MKFDLKTSWYDTRVKIQNMNNAQNNMIFEEDLNIYQQKTDKAHILDAPDTYIGSVEIVDTDMWILNESGDKIIQKNIHYIPGLYKLFDEGIVNCRDHVIRMKQQIVNSEKSETNTKVNIPVSSIEITIENDGTICMKNDGNGISVAMHPEYQIWIPELIFGHLRTSTNYNKEEKKIVGGKNGLGFKLVLIWSTEGSIETFDHNRGLKYKQEFKNNLSEICPPKIVKCNGNKPYTKISFKPDYKRLGIDGLTPDMLSLFRKRIYDVSAITDKNIKVKYNDSLIPIKNFEQYIDMYIGNKDENKRTYEECDNQRWEYAVALSPTHEFIQISFVNGISTSKGGKHVEYILNQITRKTVEYIEKKKKVKVNANSIKEQIILFIRCDIENPAFDSQTKDYMNTPSNKFGSVCNVSDKFIEKIAKMGIMDAACAITEVKENKAAKKSDGTKTKTIRGIPKLIDANWAGTDKSKNCIIIFCEGDSAKAGIVSGLSSEDRNIIGVYPMKGKILNVRGENIKKISENKEITEIKKILGLETGKEYKDWEDVSKSLRYGKIMFMTDQDADGSHIKGLCVNLFQSEWSSLLNIPGFISFMNTPILKARKFNKELLFYNNGEYESWKKSQDASNTNENWHIKYYKGLGTSTGKEFKEYFEKKKIVGFKHNGDNCNDMIDMVFNKKRADNRKSWLETYNRESYLDTSEEFITYEDFINKELIHFSKYDCDRSIPNLMDGLKISLRKILYSAFKKNLNSEIKVAQFTGYVSEHSGYHHGEASLNAAIVGMAQNFVGSNNINLLMPNGQFGSRLAGGKDSASERYIFTQLNKITRCIFSPLDDPILEYLDDDGFLVEPIYYSPIIPMILVNGTKGIGTGFSTDIMSYNPLDIIQYLKEKLRGSIDHTNEHTNEFIPYYEGFKGTVEKINENKFLIKGKYEVISDEKVIITELPVGTWTDDYKEFLENLLDCTDKTGKKIPSVIKDYNDMSSDTNVNFVITFPKGKIQELLNSSENGCNGLEKTLKLYTTNTTTNMHLFDAKDKLKKYSNVVEIIDDYYTVRLEMYNKRKQYLIDLLKKDIKIISNKVRYIEENLKGTIDLRNKKSEFVQEMLKTKGYDLLENDYRYLVKMPMDSVAEENVIKMNKEHTNKLEELKEIQNKTIEKMWLDELDVLYAEYIKYKETRDANSSVSKLNKKGDKLNTKKYKIIK